MSSLPAISSAMFNARRTSSSFSSFVRFPSGEFDSEELELFLSVNFLFTDTKISAIGGKNEGKVKNASGALANASTRHSCQSQGIDCISDRRVAINAIT